MVSEFPRIAAASAAVEQLHVRIQMTLGGVLCSSMIVKVLVEGKNGGKLVLSGILEYAEVVEINQPEILDMCVSGKASKIRGTNRK